MLNGCGDVRQIAPAVVAEDVVGESATVKVAAVKAYGENPWLDGRLAKNAADGSGIKRGRLSHSNSYRHMWLTDVLMDNPNHGTVSGPVWIRFEFDQLYKLESLWVWNYNQYQDAAIDRGLRNVTIEYSSTGGSDSSQWSTLGSYELARATGKNDYSHDDYSNSPSGDNEINFGGIAAKYVVITANKVDGNWGGQ